MNYLFGDSSPSALQFDYIDFLRDAVDFSVQVLAADERMRRGSERAIEIRHSGDAEVARLETLGATVARAIEGSDVGAAESATAQCAHSLLRSGAELMRAAVERVHASVAADIAQLESEARRDRERCKEALATLLLRHDLPEMTSELRLQQQGGSGYAARLYARALGDLQAVLELEIPATHALGHVVRVDKLLERLEVHAPEAGGFLRKEVKLRAQRLDKEHITAFVSGGAETVLHLRSAADGTGVGYDLLLRDQAPRVSLRRIGEAGELPPFDLDETDAAKLHELKDKLLAAMADLPRARKSLVEASLGEVALVDHRDPRILVEKLVALMAPVVQEIARRSLTKTELVLKRQTGDGRREEIFVSRSELLEKLRILGVPSRALFSPLGLGELPANAAPTPAPPATVVVTMASAATTADGVTTTSTAATPNSEPPPAPKTAAERSLFAQSLSVDKVAVRPPAGPAREEKAMSLDDSIERLIVSDASATPKPE